MYITIIVPGSFIVKKNVQIGAICLKFLKYGVKYADKIQFKRCAFSKHCKNEAFLNL